MLPRDSALIYFHVKVAYILYSSLQECEAAAINVSHVTDERMPNLFSR